MKCLFALALCAVFEATDAELERIGALAPRTAPDPGGLAGGELPLSATRKALSFILEISLFQGMSSICRFT